MLADGRRLADAKAGRCRPGVSLSGPSTRGSLPRVEFLCATSRTRLPIALDKGCSRTTCLSKAVEFMELGHLGTPSPAGSEQEARMSPSSYADDLGSAVHYALETTHAIAVCPFHLDLTIRMGDDAAESHAFVRARKLVKSDGTRWEGEALRKEFGRQLSKAADRYCPHCALLGDPEL
jgi:hypothetical protein